MKKRLEGGLRKQKSGKHLILIAFLFLLIELIITKAIRDLSYSILYELDS